MLLKNKVLYGKEQAFGAMAMGLLLCFIWSASAHCAPKDLGAHAQGQSFENFSIDIPHQWTVYKEESLVVLSHPQRLCALSAMVVPHQNVPFREMVISFYQNLQGKNGRDVDGGMTFDLKHNTDMPAVTRLVHVGPYFSAVTVMGHCEKYKSTVYSLRILDENAKVFEGGARAYPYLGEDAEKSYEAFKKDLKEKAAAAKIAAEKAAQEKAAQEKVDSEKAAAEQEVSEETSSEQVVFDKQN